MEEEAIDRGGAVYFWNPSIGIPLAIASALVKGFGIVTGKFYR